MQFYVMPPLVSKGSPSMGGKEVSSKTLGGRKWMRYIETWWGLSTSQPITTPVWAPKSPAPANLSSLAPYSSHSASQLTCAQTSLVVPSLFHLPSFHKLPDLMTAWRYLAPLRSFLALFNLLRLCDRSATILDSRLGGSSLRPFARARRLPFSNLRTTTIFFPQAHLAHDSRRGRTFPCLGSRQSGSLALTLHAGRIFTF